MEQILNNNKDLIDRFVNLSTCTDHVYDGRHEWFYSVIPREDISLISHIISADDIRQDLILFILEQHKNYKGKDFNSFLNLSLGWYVRDKLLTLISHAKIIRELSYEEPVHCTIDLFGTFDLRWVLSDKSLPLTDYERYLLYLDLYKCYTVNEICDIVYQDRSTLRSSLKTARDILIQELTK